VVVRRERNTVNGKARNGTYLRGVHVGDLVDEVEVLVDVVRLGDAVDKGQIGGQIGPR
jgi:hypothetical protein